MEEMKMDMSGGAAVLEAVAAIAELGLPIAIAACIPATENMPDGSATKPGDIITQLNGKTVEVNNTDAEGRLILADALTYCVRELNADRVVDIATLTGGIVVALGSTYAGLIANDDQWAERVTAASERAGELAWRLPLHPEYKELTRGKDAELTNASAKRKASSIYAGSFLEEFVDGKPWAHLDIAGTAWDVGRAYVGNGPTGYGVRLLVSLARDLAGR
jgi:leucyl aminopeptidase